MLNISWGFVCIEMDDLLKKKLNLGMKSTLKSSHEWVTKLYA